MGLLRSLAMLLLVFSFWLPRLLRAQSPPPSSSSRPARALDALLQDYTYRAFLRPKTGVIYDGEVPSNLTGIKIAGVRLRAGSLWARGVQMFKEFQIPVGVVEEPYVERLILVYHNLGNWSSVYYPVSGYVFIAPVLGLLAYDASNLSAKNLQELDIETSNQPILIKFSDVKSIPDGSVARCVSFDLQGVLNFSNVLPENTCTTFTQGHFSIVVESTAPSPAPLSPLSPTAPPGAPPRPATPTPPPRRPPSPSREGKENKKKVWIIVGSVLGGFALLVLLGLLVIWARKFKKRKKMIQMEKAAEVGETLNMTRIGSTKAPAATVTRTQPTLETEYVP